MSLKIKPFGTPLLAVALGTALAMIAYIAPLTTITAATVDLGAGPAARAWILSSTSIGLAAGLLATGVLGDAVGRRLVHVGGLVALALGSLIAAVSPDSAWVVGAHLVAGIGAAAVLSCGLATLAHAYSPGPDRLRATSVWAASVGLGLTVGGLVTAGLDVGDGWRPSFVACAVLALLLVVPTWRWVPESSAARPRRLDLPGLVLLVSGVVLLVSALTEARSGLGWSTLTPALLGLVGLTAFVLVEVRSDEPLLEPALLTHPRFAAATLGSMTLGLGMVGMASFTPTFVTLGLGHGVWGAALMVVTWAGTSVLAALLFRRLPHPMEGPLPLAVLLVGVAAGQAAGLGMSTGSSLGHLAVPMAVSGIFTGFVNAVLGREAVASVPPDRAAMGSGANNTARYVGAAFGITLFVTVATHTGGDLAAGWNNAVLAAIALTLAGAAVIALVGLRTHDNAVAVTH